MPFADNDGVQLYYETEGTGPAVVMTHGIWTDGRDYRLTGWVDGLKDDYKLVIMDMRGHGRSDKPHDPSAYAIENLIGDILAVTDDAADEAHYFGYSWGGRIGYGVALEAPHRFKSFIIGGAKAETLTTEQPNLLLNAITGGREALEELLVAMFPTEWTSLVALRLEGDMEALAAATEALVTNFPDFTSRLHAIEQPCLAFCGDQDGNYEGMQRAEQLIPNASLLTLPGLDHVGGITHSELVLPALRRFLREVSG